MFLNRLGPSQGEGESRSLFLFALEQIDGWDQRALIYNERTAREAEYQACLDALERQIPIQYHFGRCHFHGLELEVNPHVLIPRPETEELVQWVMDDLQQESKSILDIGTGSGCIALALAHALPKCKIRACDTSKEALKVARGNAERLQLDVEFITLDVLAQDPPLAEVIVSNPPYIPEAESGSLAPQVIEHEPSIALFVPDTDPLIFYRRIFELTATRKAVCYVEIHEDYQLELEELLTKFGGSYQFRLDLQGKCRMLCFKANEII